MCLFAKGFEDGLIGPPVVWNGGDREWGEGMGDRSFQWLFDELFDGGIVGINIGWLANPFELLLSIYESKMFGLVEGSDDNSIIWHFTVL